MLDDINHLQKILTRQLDAYQRLLRVLESERSLIENNAIDGLTQNTRQKEDLIHELKSLDQDYSQLLHHSDDDSPSVKHPLSLTAIIRAAKSPDLKKTYFELKTVTGKVKKLNATNKIRINGSLRIVKNAISFLTSCAKNNTPFYEAGGQIKSDNLTSALICEEA